MQIRFMGATGTVTGSRYLLTYQGTKVLVDAGLFQGFKNLRLKNWESFPIPPHELDAIILTHAHLDHSGYIPLLVKNGFRGPIYATAPTVDLCRILLPDSGYLQEEEAKFANRRGYSKHSPAMPLYTHDDAQTSLRSFVSVPWKKTTTISKKGGGPLEVQFHPAGHLLGAASLLIRGNGTSIAFSGDLGRKTDPLIREPAFHGGADYLVVESTYGNRHHPDRDPEDEIKTIILRTLSRQGIVLIPSFAVGRAQLILYYILRLKIKNAIPRDLPVYLNSPMAAQANLAFSAHAGEAKINADELKDLWKSVHIIGTPEESIALNEKDEPSIIIAASGMATGGRVLHHLKTLAPDPKNTILFAGFQAGGTRGDLMVRGAQEIKIHGEYWKVRADVMNLETLSAHADSDEILEWIQTLDRSPKQIFVTHGEPEAADELRRRISDNLGISALVPDLYQEFRLS
ncbi:MAG: MBL fold metallo-hydrolase [Bdellovibrionaceae bacterium]|nr:MBL fold metallo-hydrolase [Pseudobdellovibrionaceae bacterium]